MKKRVKITLISSLIYIFVAPFILVGLQEDFSFKNFLTNREYRILGSDDYNPKVENYARAVFSLKPEVQIDLINIAHIYNQKKTLLSLAQRYNDAESISDHKDVAILLQIVASNKTGMPEFGKHTLSEVEDSTSSLYAYTRGLLAYRDGKLELAESSFREAYLNGLGDFAAAELGLLLVYENREKDYRNLAYEWDFRKIHGYHVRKDIYLTDGSYWWYFMNVIDYTFDGITIYGLIGVAFAALFWLMVFKEVLHIKGKWGITIIVALLSYIFMLFVFPISDYLISFERSIGIEWHHNHLLYDIVNIGMLEEAVKLVPWVIVYLILKNQIKKPTHFAYLPFVSAITFAFVENLSYVGGDSYELIIIRSTLCIGMHTSCAVVIGYSYLLAKAGKIKLPPILALLIGWFIASFIHGFYDFCAFNSLRTVGLISFLIAMFFMSRMTNNLLNISGIKTFEQQLRIEAIAYLFLIGIVGVFLMEYMVIGIEFGRFYASAILTFGLIASVISGVFLFGVFHRIYLRPGIIEPISMSATLKQFTATLDLDNFHLYKGKQIRLFARKSNRLLSGYFPMIGTFKDELKTADGQFFYLIELDRSINYKGLNYTKALITPKNRKHDILLDKIEVVFFVLNDAEINGVHLRGKNQFTYLGRVFGRPIDSEIEVS